jgi:hypothetical protein
MLLTIMGELPAIGCWQCPSHTAEHRTPEGHHNCRIWSVYSGVSEDDGSITVRERENAVLCLPVEDPKNNKQKQGGGGAVRVRWHVTPYAAYRLRAKQQA